MQPDNFASVDGLLPLSSPGVVNKTTMVPFAARLLLVLAATSAADDILKRPVRHRRSYGNRTSIETTSSSTTGRFEYVPPSTAVSAPSEAEITSAAARTNDDNDATAHFSRDPTSSSPAAQDVTDALSFEPNPAFAASSPPRSLAEILSYHPAAPLTNIRSIQPAAMSSYEPSTTATSANGPGPRTFPSGPGSPPQTGSGVTPLPARPTGHIPSGLLPPGYLPSGNVASGQLPPYVPSGPRPSFHPPHPTNTTCGGATLNIARASLDYWYSETYTHVDSTFVIQFGSNASSTGWTLVPAAETLNVTSAVEAPSCTSTTAFNTLLNSTMLEYSCWKTPTPVAAATSTVEQMAYLPVNQTTSRGAIPDVVVTPTPAALTIDDSTDTVGQGTTVVRFSQVEVISKKSLGQHMGVVRCATMTHVHQLSEPLSFEYEGGQVDAMLVTGTIHTAMRRAVEEDTGVSLSRVSLGTFAAEPTVVVVVQKVLAAATPAILAVESASTLDTPTPTLPSGLSFVETTPTETGVIWTPTARIESSDTALMLPSTPTSPDRVIPLHAHVESSVPNPASQIDGTNTNQDVTATSSGHAVTATGGETAGSGSSGGNDVEGIRSAIVHPIEPAHALDVLNNALHTFANHNVGATVSGVGGPVDSPNGGSGSGSHSGLGSSGSGPHSAGQAAPNAGFDVGTSAVTATSVGAGAFVAGGDTGPAGGAGMTVNGQDVSIALGAHAVVIGGTTPTRTAPAHPAAVAKMPLITVGSHVFTANAATQFDIGGSVLTPGGQVVVRGTTVSLAPGATRVAVNGAERQLSPGAIVVAGGTMSLPADGSHDVLPAGAGGSPNEHRATVTARPVLSVDGTAFSPRGGTSYIISGQTLTPGGAITFDGPHGRETLSLNAGADRLARIANGQTVTSPIGRVGAASGGAPVLTVGGNTHTAVEYHLGSGATDLIGGQTLTPGGVITISGPTGADTISLLAQGTAMVITSGGRTTTWHIRGACVGPPHAPVLTLGGETYAARHDGATCVIDGRTLTPGGVDTVTVHGRTYVVRLSRHATLLDMVQLGAHGHALTTLSEPLPPAAATGAPVASSVRAPAATEAAAPSHPAAPPPHGPATANTAATSPPSIHFSPAVIIALASWAWAIGW